MYRLTYTQYVLVDNKTLFHYRKYNNNGYDYNSELKIIECAGNCVSQRKLGDYLES